MDFYRVERGRPWYSKGPANGPYWHVYKIVSASGYVKKHYGIGADDYCIGRPSPDSDGIYDLGDNDIFGFDSLEKLVAWFGDKPHCEYLAKYKYRVSRFEAEHVTNSTPHQATADKTCVRRVSYVTIRDPTDVNIEYLSAKLSKEATNVQRQN